MDHLEQPAAQASNALTRADQRIAIIVPRKRAWPWHGKVIARLRQIFSVDVFTSDVASPYPTILRHWLRLEGKVLFKRDRIEPADFSGPAWPPTNDAPSYTMILNFSEEPIADASIPVLQPEFDGSVDSLFLIATLVAQKIPYLAFRRAGDKDPIAASYPSMEDRIHLSGRLQLAFSRLAALAERGVLEFITGSRDAMIASPPGGTHLAVKESGWAWALLRPVLAKIFSRLLRPFRNENHWFVAILRSDAAQKAPTISTAGMRILADDRRHFYADPFLFTDDQSIWLFVEDLEYRMGKGVISCTRLDGDARIETPAPVLVRPYHLSYPFVFRHADAIYMIPETSHNRTVELYRADAFPYGWALEQTLLDDIRLADATLLQHEGRWWMFGAVSHDGGSSQDELAIFYSERLEGPWHPHFGNPVKSDCRSARPAGHLVRSGGRLLRPAQDCELGYGAALVWMEIEELTPTRFRERQIEHWAGDPILPVSGLHTFNRDDGVSVIDMKRPVWKWPHG